MVCLLTLGVGCSVLWCLFLFPPWGAVTFCLRTSTDPSSLWLSLCFAFGHRRSLLVSAWPLCCGNFDGDSVCLYLFIIIIIIIIIICGSTRSRPLSSRLVPSDSSRFVAVDWGVFARFARFGGGTSIGAFVPRGLTLRFGHCFCLQN
jgi:hypothetical protein